MSDESYFLLLKETLENTDIDKKILLTGESTICRKRFIQTVQICKEYGFDVIINTTGKGLSYMYLDKSLSQYLIGSISKIIINRMAIEQNENNKIFHGENITKEQIEDYIFFFKMNDIKIEIASEIFKNTTLNDVLDFVEFYHNLGCETISFDVIDECNINFDVKYKNMSIVTETL